MEKGSLLGIGGVHLQSRVVGESEHNGKLLRHNPIVYFLFGGHDK
jgi:hypothetical protein